MAVKIPYEAREKALAALVEDKDWHKPDSGGVWRANYHRAVELVLEAAAPVLAAQPVEPARPMPTREQIEHAVRAAGIGSYSTIVTEALLALLNGDPS